MEIEKPYLLTSLTDPFKKCHESKEIPLAEKHRISQIEIVKACTLMRRLSPPPFTAMNHFGVLIKLANGEKYLIHNSPGNEGENGTEIIVHENEMKHEWEMHMEWQDTVRGLTIKDVMRPMNYKMFNSNCFHTVSRIWSILVREEQFDILFDPKRPKILALRPEERLEFFIERLRIYKFSQQVKLLQYQQFGMKRLSPPGLYLYNLSRRVFSKRNLAQPVASFAASIASGWMLYKFLSFDQ